MEYAYKVRQYKDSWHFYNNICIPQEPIRASYMQYVCRLNRTDTFKRTWLKTDFKSRAPNRLIFIKKAFTIYWLHMLQCLRQYTTYQ